MDEMDVLGPIAAVVNLCKRSTARLACVTDYDVDVLRKPKERSTESLVIAGPRNLLGRNKYDPGRTGSTYFALKKSGDATIDLMPQFRERNAEEDAGRDSPTMFARTTSPSSSQRSTADRSTSSSSAKRSPGVRRSSEGSASTMRGG